MLDKELEILRLIEELYHGDTTDEEMLEFAEKNQTKVQTWKEAFEEYPLFEVTKAINQFYVKKSSKTRPNIAQITAILQANNVTREIRGSYEKVEPSFGMKFLEQDELEGNMHWFVPDYQTVENLIRNDHWGWVSNIKNPTIDEFHRCLEEWCMERTGHKYRFYSENDIAQMSQEKKDELLQKCREIFRGFSPKKLN